MSDYDLYVKALKTNFRKLCRLRFLNPDGSTAFAVDNSAKNKYSGAFISSGNITVNLQNGQRRTATVTFSNVDNDFDYNVNNLWFGSELALDEGLVLQDGSEYYIQQGVFVLADPTEDIKPYSRTISYNLVDKWANIDGSLFGNLEGAYEVALGTNIFTPIKQLLAEDRGNGRAVDNIPPVFTNYYDGKTQELPDGTTAALTAAPYTLTVDGGGTKADVVLGLVGMLNAWVGYDSYGALEVEPSQDDIDDSAKPVSWTFTPEETQMISFSYSVKNSEVYNDYIVVGDEMDDYTQPYGRAENYDPSSDTNINLIGRKTYRETASGYATDTQCQDLAAWKLKRAMVLQKEVSIHCSQIFHIRENTVIEIIRTDKKGSPVEKHLVQGFTRPLVGNETMTINAVSVKELPVITVT